jgi:hypothetical protein
MVYKDGQKILVGDLVAIDSRYRGTVVACVTYLPPVSGGDLGYLRTGIMVNTDFSGLVHYPDAKAIEHEGMELLARKVD